MRGLATVDAFDLPEWLGTGDVTWHAEAAADRLGGHLVHGLLVGDHVELPCDLLGVDRAWPEPVTDDATRVLAHQAWRNGQVLLVEHEDRLTLAVPGTGFTADRILTALARLAKAVGAPPENFVAAMRLGVVDDHG
ncbi:MULTISPECIES: hypothetical protein [unclassified Nocardioides]|uniref:hypothetical protein n=1 Tax=unclassified Nocardioides TaxID=2615069 RepID=UPI0007001B55|nr:MULTISPECIES: hypothetical protein [unclassified Nocardioides]KQY64487.1 hypothetical protein ASD30_06070 [Nocardioides sp. Root140]KQZ70411.1 hypothetical protein ASD66_12400 [Nocardioides sp. Root151]KRF18272.1 hypothetical protein ASH02_01540 [Nocardioides sp. Soil796]